VHFEKSFWEGSLVFTAEEAAIGRKEMALGEVEERKTRRERTTTTREKPERGKRGNQKFVGRKLAKPFAWLGNAAIGERRHEGKN